jgi:hypothetical protein
MYSVDGMERGGHKLAAIIELDPRLPRGTQCGVHMSLSIPTVRSPTSSIPLRHPRPHSAIIALPAGKPLSHEVFHQEAYMHACMHAFICMYKVYMPRYLRVSIITGFLCWVPPAHIHTQHTHTHSFEMYLTLSMQKHPAQYSTPPPLPACRCAASIVLM